jgi:hypothetical protein
MRKYTGSICDFTVTPTLACNKDRSCEACTDQTKKTDDKLKTACEKVGPFAEQCKSTLDKDESGKDKGEAGKVKEGGGGSMGTVAVSTFILAGSILYYSIVAAISFPV